MAIVHADPNRDDLAGRKVLFCVEDYDRLFAEAEKLQAFKDWVHKYLDDHGVPASPPGPHGAEGCRIGDRLDWLFAALRAGEVVVSLARC